MLKTRDIKPKRGLGEEVTRQRRKEADRIRRETASRERRQRDEARSALARSRRESTVADKWKHSVLSATVSAQRAVMHSYGIDVLIDADVTYGNSFRASTDMSTRINISIGEDYFPPETAQGNEIVDMIAKIKGMFQHELGHIRFTRPWGNVRNNADAPDTIPTSYLQHDWNILEDQRMESAVVADVPRLASYFTKMVVTFLLGDDVSHGRNDRQMKQSWLLLAGRQYLPREVRELSRQMFANAYAPELATTWLEIVNEYKRATTDQELMDAVVKAYTFRKVLEDTFNEVIDAGETTGHSVWDTNDNDADAGATEAEDEPQDDAQDEQSAPADDESDDESEASDKPANDSEADDSDDDGDDSQPSDIDTLRDLLDDVGKTAGSAMREDRELHDIVKHANSIATDASLPPMTSQGKDFDEATLAKAESIAVGVEDALNDFFTASQPAWHSHQENGVIEPLIYRTKSVGDMAYRRDMEGEVNEGLDVHVSILADASVSMNDDGMHALSVAMYSTALACDRLGIGSTYTLWSSREMTHSVWNDGDYQPVVWPTLGSTDPTKALDDLVTHNREGASNHLVIVFTDGEWMDNFPGLQCWSEPDRHILLVKYGVRSPSTLGSDAMCNVTEIEQLPNVMAEAIATLI
jgi:hypothetical protein